MGQRRGKSARIGPASSTSSLTKKMFFAASLHGRINAIVALAAIALAMVVAGGAVHRFGSGAKSPGEALLGPAKAASNPALSTAEEAYLQALWPVHGDVERSAVRVSLGTIFYKTGDLEAPALKDRLETALAVYRSAEARISDLKPPPSFARRHEEYLAAVRLYEQATVEALKMSSDGDDAHLIRAHSLSQEGSNKIREIGGRFWRDEFPPN